MRIAINAAVIENGEILLVRKKDSWILPGGKPEQNESDIECLLRESEEELNHTVLENFSFYKSFEGKTPHKGDILQAKVYFSNIKGELKGQSREISDAKFVKNTREYNLSDITSKIIESLKKDKYL